MIIFLCAFLINCFNGRAQNREAILVSAGQHWMQGDYTDAADYYSEALKLDSSDLFTAFRLAECYRFDNRYTDAARIYNHVITLPDARHEKPEVWFYLAMMTKQYGDIDRFCELISSYLEFGNDTLLVAKARREEMICKNRSLLPKDTNSVRITHLGRTINTPWSEFGAFQISDSILFFSALRPTTESEFQSFARLDYRSAIYISRIRLSGYQRGRELGNNINRRNTHNANITFDKSGKRVFFSRCSDLDNGLLQCRIMVASYNNGRWRMPRPLPESINMPGYTNTQPHYSQLGDAGVLYFVSDRPGGHGGMDVWFSLEHDGSFAVPVNCGSLINTKGNEVTPFYDTAREAMFFSSDWHHGFGGYDIFMADGGLSAWEKPVNIGVPFNSPANDYYYTVNPNDSNGYFTSNRPGSFHLRGETCCNDIYMYEWVDKEVITIIPEQPVTTTDTVQELARRLLPLLLFFHNDEPDAATMSITSSKDYKQSLDEYVSIKMLYRREYARGLKGEAAARAADDIEDFFTDYVMGGYQKLEMLTDFLVRDLTDGNTVQLLISGYCSPLSTNEYNINLARRRINSLVKYLENARGGVLKPYIDGVAPGGIRLIIFEDPVGKEKASPFVSDNPNDLRNSVYSRAAAFERRIEITFYQSHKPGEMILLSELPIFSTPTDTIVLKPVKSGERRVISIPYSNKGKSELLIRGVDFNGERVWVEWSNEPLLPGGELTLMVLVTPGKENGVLIENLVINTNLPEPYVITIVGEVYE